MHMKKVSHNSQERFSMCGERIMFSIKQDSLLYSPTAYEVASIYFFSIKRTSNNKATLSYQFPILHYVCCCLHNALHNYSGTLSLILWQLRVTVNFSRSISNCFLFHHGKECAWLTYADGDISRPLVVVLAGYHLFPNELKPKLAFKAQNISI